MNNKRIENKVKKYRKQMEKWEQKEIDKKQMKERYNSMSLVERNAYESIMKRQEEGSWINLATIPFRVFIYLGLFGIVLKYFYFDGLSGFDSVYSSLKNAGWITLGILQWTFIIAFIGWILEKLYLSNYKRKLLLK